MLLRFYFGSVQDRSNNQLSSGLGQQRVNVGQQQSTRDPLANLIMAEDGLIQKLIDTVTEISAISDYRCMMKKLFSNLVQRLKLLTLLFEDVKKLIPDDSHQAFLSLMEDLESAKELLRVENEGSKIHLVNVYVN
ncbi:hypothetical protein Hdeb2414_s0013g00416761 [Helianthus debilis subsp. tardiflorus]